MGYSVSIVASDVARARAVVGAPHLRTVMAATGPSSCTPGDDACGAAYIFDFDTVWPLPTAFPTPEPTGVPTLMPTAVPTPRPTPGPTRSAHIASSAVRLSVWEPLVRGPLAALLLALAVGTACTASA